MTRQEFLELQNTIVCDMTRAVERNRDRIRAVTYGQALQNARDGVPLFGWHPLTPQTVRDERVAMYEEWNREAAREKKPWSFITAEDELWSALYTVIAVYKMRARDTGYGDHEMDLTDKVIIDLLENFIDEYPGLDRPEKTN